MRPFKRSRREGNNAANNESAELLPWYLNNTLSADGAGTVEVWLRQYRGAAMELAAWQQVQQAVTNQPAEAPSLAVYERVREPVRSGPAYQPVPWLPRLAWGVAVGLAVLVFLWLVLQPGIVLGWSVQGDPVRGFRVYRAPLGTADFGLVGEVPSDVELQEYHYVDTQLWPGQSFIYRVEAVGMGGQTILSHTTTANGLEAFPGQAGILLTGLAVGLGAAILLDPRWSPRHRLARVRSR